MGIGDKYATCMSTALKRMPHVNLIGLSNNRLSDRVYNFITNLHENIEELNLSKNNLGIASINEITKLVWSPTSALRNIYLSDCHLSDP